MNHPNAKFDYTGHFHSEYEINLVINGRGERIVGDNIEKFEGTDLVMIGPNVPHRWTTGDEALIMHVVTIQFPKETLDYQILRKKIFHPIHQLCNDAFRGIVFSEPAKGEPSSISYEPTSSGVGQLWAPHPLSRLGGM